MVTSNHVHLLVKDTGGDFIAQSMQLIAGSERRKTAIGAKTAMERSGRTGITLRLSKPIPIARRDFVLDRTNCKMGLGTLDARVYR
jgi:hypothetical protein